MSNISYQNILDNFLSELRKKDMFSKDIYGEYHEYPYPHVRIFNLFNKEVYEKMCSLSEGIMENIHDDTLYNPNGNKKYAKMYGVKATDIKNTGFEFFSSKAWRDFISNLFNIDLEPYLSMAIHLHEGSENSPSTLGWSHADSNVCSFRSKPREDEYLNGVQFSDDLYTVSTMDYNPDDIVKMYRSSAFLFYLNNKIDLNENDGGGTVIYADKSNDNPIKIVPPINNSLFLFKISPYSYHGAQPAKFHRYVCVGWTHSEPARVLSKNMDIAKQCIEDGNIFFEEWDISNPWNVEKSPFYTNYFDKPLKYLFN